MHQPIKLSTTKTEEANFEPVPKKPKKLPYGIIVSRSYCLFYYNKKLLLLFIFQTFRQLTTRSFTINIIQFTVSNKRTKCILDFGPDSVVLSV